MPKLVDSTGRVLLSAAVGIVLVAVGMIMGDRYDLLFQIPKSVFDILIGDLLFFGPFIIPVVLSVVLFTKTPEEAAAVGFLSILIGTMIAARVIFPTSGGEEPRASVGQLIVFGLSLLGALEGAAARWVADRIARRRNRIGGG